MEESLNGASVSELREIAKRCGVKSVSAYRKAELIEKIREAGGVQAMSDGRHEEDREKRFGAGVEIEADTRENGVLKGGCITAFNAGIG